MTDKRLEQYTDRELMMEVLNRRYTGEAFVRVVRPYTETVEVKTVNGRQVKNTKSIEYERVEYGHPMDMHTKFMEFDLNGKLVQIGESRYANY